MKYVTFTILMFLVFSANAQKYKVLNKLSYNSTVKPGTAIMYGNFIQRLGFNSGGFSQEVRIINVDTDEVYSFTVKPTLKSAKENTFIYFIKPGTYAILNYWWAQSKWYGGKVFTEPIYKGKDATVDFNENRKAEQKR